MILIPMAIPHPHDLRGHPQRAPPDEPAHAGRPKAGSRTAASQSQLHTRTFNIAY
jgi:hypothetical protein